MLLETDLKGMFILKQVNKENLFFFYWVMLPKSYLGILQGWLGQRQLPSNPEPLDGNFLSFLTLRHLRTNIIVYRKKP